MGDRFFALDAAAGPAEEGERRGRGVCLSCGEPLPPYGGNGRPQIYCGVACRRRAEQARKARPTDPAEPPPLLPPLTAVQRAWVVGMAAGWERERERRRAGCPPPLALGYAEWARRRWGRRRTEMLRCLALAVGEWRREQERGA